MLKAKKNSMYIDVTGVDDMTDRSTLMEEIIRRNCDVDPRIINSLVNKLGRYGDENHMLKSPRPAVFRSPRFTVRSTNNNQLRKRL